MRILRAVAEALRLAVARETLGHEDPPPHPPGAAPARGVVHVVLVSREPLGTEPEAPRRAGGSLLRALLALEDLPHDPVPPQPRPPGRLARLFAIEKLDRSP